MTDATKLIERLRNVAAYKASLFANRYQKQATGLEIDAATLIEQQAARIAEYERKERSTARLLCRHGDGKLCIDGAALESAAKSNGQAVLSEERIAQIAHYCETEAHACPGTSMWQCAHMAVEETLRALAEPYQHLQIAEVCEDADGFKHIEAVIEDLDDIPKGTKLYTAPAATDNGGGRDALVYPSEFTDDLKWILGLMCFQCIPYAQTFRAAGVDVPKKAEAEQAYTLDWLLRRYLKDPENWRKTAVAEMRALSRKAGEQG
ncbi:MAG TPA: hypothetical protein VF447_00115 [Terriglobales bacterium]